jgi:hypothetical protein
MAVYCKRNKHKIKFIGKVSVLEVKRRNPVVDGTVLELARDKFKELYDQRRVECLIVTIGMAILIGLTYIAYINMKYEYGAIPSYTCVPSVEIPGASECSPTGVEPPSVQVRTADIASRFIGSVAVTVFVSLVSILSVYFHLRKYTIKWAVPEVEEIT